jgi:predicted RND superfamily exporter protein
MDILNILLEKKGAGLNAEEESAKDAYALEQIRTRRNNLLALTDKYTASDFSMTDSEKTAILAYRQALRDITKTKAELDWNTAKVTNITWPTSPFVSDYDMIISGIN